MSLIQCPDCGYDINDPKSYKTLSGRRTTCPRCKSSVAISGARQLAYKKKSKANRLMLCTIAIAVGYLLARLLLQVR